jgi:hypothetical protein
VMAVAARSRWSSSGRSWAISSVVRCTWVWPGLGQDRAGGVVHRREQVDRRVGVVAAAAKGLAVDGDRPRRPAGRWPAGRWRWLLAGQPAADGAVQRVGVDAGQDAAHGRLCWWLEGAGPWVAAHVQRGQRGQRGQHLAGRVRGPLADGRQRPGTGQHRADRDAEHAHQRVSSAAPMSGVSDGGKVVEQAAALVRCQGGGRGRRHPLGGGGMGDDEGAGTAVRSGHGLGYHRIAGSRACFTSTRLTHPDHHQRDNPALCRGPGVVGRVTWPAMSWARCSSR